MDLEDRVSEPADADRDHEVASLFRRHYTRMCRLAYVIVGDRSLAEEVVMEALVRTYSGWRRIRDLDRSEAYLRQAVINGWSIDYIKLVEVWAARRTIRAYMGARSRLDRGLLCLFTTSADAKKGGQ